MLIKRIVLIVIFVIISLLLLAPLMPKVVVFRILVYRGGGLTPAMVYVFAAYPGGFRFLRGLRTETGFAEVTLDLTGMFEEWGGVRDREITPTFLVAAITDDGDAVMKAFNIEWSKLKPASMHTLVVELGERGRRLASRAPCPLKMLGAEATCPRTGPASQAIIVDAYGERKRVNILKVMVDDKSWANAHYVYIQGYKAGFSIAYALLSTEAWDIAGWYYVSKEEGGSKTTYSGRGGTAVVSMEMDFLYQKWCYYDPQGNLVNEEVRAYVDNFYPKTINDTPGIDLPSVDNWEYKGTNTSQGVDIPYYIDDHEKFGGESFAVNLLWFLSALSLAGKLPAWATAAANYASLFLDVDYKYETDYAFAFNVVIYGDEGATHDVYRAWQEFPGLDTPALHYRVELRS